MPMPSPTSTPSATPTPTASPAPTSLDGPDTVRVAVEEVARDLPAPWGLAFLPGGSALVTLRDEARVVVVDASGRTTRVTGPGAQQLADWTRPAGEGGLLGVTVLPGGSGGTDVAFYLTAARDNRVVRGTLDGTRLGSLDVVLTGIPKAANHDGGRLAVGPDGFLYVSTGDASEPDRALEEDSLGGKILRVTPDGDPAPGNPDRGSPVWSSGHRNVQGLGWASDGRMFASEFGQSTWDELNLVRKGGNYGWPIIEGKGGEEHGFDDPLVTWATKDASPSGLAVTGEGVYLAGLRGQTLWRVPLRPKGVGTPQPLLRGEHGRLRDVAVAPDGSLWVLTNNTDGRGDPRAGDDRILRVTVR
nr:PQQ-dependent sugar dehydrogenase [Cellulomonas massiliensis]